MFQLDSVELVSTKFGSIHNHKQIRTIKGLFTQIREMYMNVYVLKAISQSWNFIPWKNKSHASTMREIFFLCFKT